MGKGLNNSLEGMFTTGFKRKHIYPLRLGTWVNCLLVTIVLCLQIHVLSISTTTVLNLQWCSTKLEWSQCKGDAIIWRNEKNMRWFLKHPPYIHIHFDIEKDFIINNQKYICLNSVLEKYFIYKTLWFLK